ncbi:hypothetical protein LMIY3S_03707 [Labrys miyagiensis]
MRYAVIENGIVVNAIIWDGESEWSPPEGQQVVQSDAATIGDSYDGTSFTPPPAT